MNKKGIARRRENPEPYRASLFNYRAAKGADMEKETTKRDGIFIIEPPSPRPANAAELEKKMRAMFADWERISTPEKMLNDLRGQVLKALSVKPPALTRKPREADKRRMEARERRKKDLQYILKEIDWLLRTHKESSRNHVDFFNLGMLACKANMRLIEPIALAGRNSLKGAPKGGGVQKSSEDILRAVSEVLEKAPDLSASKVWTHLRRNAEEYDLVFQKDHTGNGKDTLADLAGKAITFGTFRSYFTKAKRNLKIVAQ